MTAPSMTTNKPPYGATCTDQQHETHVLSKHDSHAKTNQTSGCEDRPSARPVFPTVAGVTGNAIDDELLAAVRDYGYAAWEHGFRSEPGSMGTTPYVQDLEKKKKAKEVALLTMIQKRLADPGLLPSGHSQETMMAPTGAEKGNV